MHKQSGTRDPLDERVTLRTFDGQLTATEELLRRYMNKELNEVSVDTACKIIGLSRQVLNDEKRWGAGGEGGGRNPATGAAGASQAGVTPDGPFAVVSGGRKG